MKSILFCTLLVLISIEVIVASKGECGGNVDPINSTCHEIFDIFHKCTGKFIEVALDKANPFTLCTDKQAHNLYRNLMYWLSMLDQIHDKNYFNITCSDEYLNKNQMAVISHVVATSKSIWESAYCDDCYIDTSRTNNNFSDHTIIFQESYKNYSDCVSKHPNNATAICEHCMSEYLSMNALFDHDKTKRNGQICFDLEDIMNKTRQQWSVDFKCCRDKHDSLTAFYSLFSTILVLTAIFYLTIYITGSCYTEASTLDANEISNEVRPSTSSSGSSSTPSNAKPNTLTESPDKKLINIDSDSDDEANILNNVTPSPNNNLLIKLDN